MSDIIDGGVSKVNCKFRDDGVIEIDLPIVGSKITKKTRIGNPSGASVTFDVGTLSPELTKGSEHGRNTNSNVSITGFNGGDDIRIYHCLYEGWGDYSLTGWDKLRWWSTFGAYDVFGILSYDAENHKGSGIVIESSNPDNQPFLENSPTKNMMTERTDSILINWTETLKPITDPTSPNYLDSTKYRINAYDGAVDPVLWKLMDKTKKESIIDNSVGDIVADIEHSYFVGEDNTNSSLLDGKKIAGSYRVDGDGNAIINSNDSYTILATKDGQNCYYVTFHPYIKLFLTDWSEITLTDWKEDQVAAVGTEDNNITNDNIDDADKKDATDNAESNTVTTTIGSIGGIRRTHTHYNDYKTSFDVTYLSSGDYNNFVSAGGGIISDSIVHANDKALFITSIDLNISGNTMTVVQLEKFDNTLKLTVGEKIFGYIINNDGDVQPEFTGYVVSFTRRLGARGQEIVYKCKDWKYYFNQLYTPMIYRKKDTIRNIVNDLLIKSGVTNFTNSLPNLTVTVEYQAESIMTVLDWACTIAGDYWFWIDVNGKLHIDQIDGSVNSFRVPSVAEAVGTNKVLNFDSLTDLSNSRSRIVVSGGSGSKIYEQMISTRYKASTHYNSIQEAIDAGASGEIGIFKSAGDVTETKTYLVDDGNFSGGEFGTYHHSGDNYVWYKDGKGKVKVGDEYVEKDKYYHKRTDWTQPTYDHYYIYRKKNVEFYSEMIAEGRQAWADHYYCSPTSPTGRGNWKGEGGVSIQNDTIRGDSVVYAHRDSCIMDMYFAEKRQDEDLTVYIDTGQAGGTYLYKNASFRFVKGFGSIVDDTPLMKAIAANLANYFKPVYGGTLTLAGLRTELELGQKISLTNTDLPATEAQNLKIFGISFDIATKTTQVRLSSRTNSTGTSIDPEIIKNNMDYYRRALADNNSFIIRTTLKY